VRLSASTGLFEVGQRMAFGFGVTGAALFAALGVGPRFGRTPTGGRALGRVQAARVMRWVCLGGAVVGLALMGFGAA
jgi:hypothetical protein